MAHPDVFDPTVFERGQTDNLQNVFDKDGNFKVSVQDQDTPLVDLLLHQELNSVTLASDIALNADKTTRTATFTAGHGFVVGNYCCLQEPTYSEKDPALIIDRKFYQGRVVSVSVNTVTLDTPFSHAFTASETSGSRANANANVNGSVTPVAFNISPGAGISFDIVRIIFYVQGIAAMDDGLFGDQTALQNGVVVRRLNEETTFNIFNVKSNGDFKLRNFDGIYSDKAPNGKTTFLSRRTFGGQEKNGVVVRVDGDFGDKLQVLIQDNLTAVDDFLVVAQGHVGDPS